MDDTDQLLPLCFVLMPFGKKMDAAGRVTNFDAVYARIIAPAVEHSGLEPIRADEEKIGGTIHKPMFERLMLCHYAVADITGANPNVFYELGIRHAMRPRSTVIVFAEGTVLPFDIALVRGLAYKTDGAGEPVDAETTLRQIADQLQSARGNPFDDSPIFQLVEGVPRWEIDHSKTDIFRKAVDYSKRYKDRLRAAVKEGADSVKFNFGIRLRRAYARPARTFVAHDAGRVRSGDPTSRCCIRGLRPRAFPKPPGDPSFCRGCR